MFWRRYKDIEWDGPKDRTLEKVIGKFFEILLAILVYGALALPFIFIYLFIREVLL